MVVVRLRAASARGRAGQAAAGPAPRAPELKKEPGMPPAQTGKRYVCPDCGAEFIVTRGGEAELRCGETALEEKK